MSDNQRVAVVHANDGSDVRIGKVCRSLSAAGIDCHFIGWDRRPNEAKSIDLGATTRHVFMRETQYGRATVTGQLRYLFHVISTLTRIRPHVVCAVNEDVACLLAPFKRILFKKLICDIFDSFADRHSQRSLPFRMVAKIVTSFGRRGSDQLIVTDENRLSRLGDFGEKATVIENVPEDPGEALSQIVPEGGLKVFVGGTLNRARGLEQILEAVSKIRGAQILCAGWPYDNLAEEFIQHERVEYRGIVTLQESLAMAAQCDVVMAYYEPRSINNVNASPNKIYDAMSVGRPVIVNSEIVSAAWVEKNRVGYACPYHDSDALLKILHTIQADRERRVEFGSRARSLFLSSFTWEIMEIRLISLYKELLASQ